MKDVWSNLLVLFVGSISFMAVGLRLMIVMQGGGHFLSCFRF